MDSSDAQRAAIERAVKAAALRQLTVDEAVAAVTSAMAMPSRETMLAEVFRLEQEGRRPSAVMLVARKYASDPTNPIAVDSLARKIRRWRKKNGHVSAH
jgi:hypothetical protein